MHKLTNTNLIEYVENLSSGECVDALNAISSVASSDEWIYLVREAISESLKCDKRIRLRRPSASQIICIYLGDDIVPHIGVGLDNLLPLFIKYRREKALTNLLHQDA